MSEAGAARTVTRIDSNRTIGRVTGQRPGPTVIFVSACHGNEPAGVEALNRVLPRLGDYAPELNGDVLGVIGNLAALEKSERFIDEDLNRLWTDENLAVLSKPDRKPPLAEEAEVLELLRLLQETIRYAQGEVYIVDLHTTSGESAPFAAIGDTLRNRNFALNFPIPIVLGVEEHIAGTLLDFMGNFGYVTCLLEGGQHDDPESVTNLEAGIWVALRSAGVLGEVAERTEALAAYDRLRRTAGGLPRVVEVRYRHAFAAEDRFRMLPGFRSFQPVRGGELLAQDRDGEVRAPEEGLLFMPLYQELGDDGFFIVREFRAVWLGISAWLRHIKLDSFVHWLPGVRRSSYRRDTLIVDRAIARWFAVQFFHLLGYRRFQWEGKILIVSRRREEPPSSPTFGEVG